MNDDFPISAIDEAMRQPAGKFELNAVGALLYHGRLVPRNIVECLDVMGFEATLQFLANGHQRAADIARERLAEIKRASDEARVELERVCANGPEK